jgi:hypothetical protein
MWHGLRSMCLVVAMIVFCGCGQSVPPLAGAKWAAALRDPGVRVRKKAAFALGNIGLCDTSVLPAVLAGLQDADGGVRCQAILALLKFGPAGRQAIPELDRMKQKDPDTKVRQYAARAMEQLSLRPLLTAGKSDAPTERR